MDAVRTVCACVLAASFFVPLAVAVVVDLRDRRIPNGCVWLIALGGLLQWGLCAVDPAAPFSWLAPGIERLLCCLGCLGVGVAAEMLWRRRHAGAHGMGMGDIKLLAAVALWIGSAVFVAVGAACLLALAVETPRGCRTFAFGPYIAVASVVCLVVAVL